MTTDPYIPPGDRLFALIASIPGSGTVDWCGEARALLDEIRAVSAVPSRAAVLREAADIVHGWDTDPSTHGAAEYLRRMADEEPQS